jgi:hypothetical protein
MTQINCLKSLRFNLFTLFFFMCVGSNVFAVTNIPVKVIDKCKNLYSCTLPIKQKLSLDTSNYKIKITSYSSTDKFQISRIEDYVLFEKKDNKDTTSTISIYFETEAFKNNEIITIDGFKDSSKETFEFSLNSSTNTIPLQFSFVGTPNVLLDNSTTPMKTNLKVFCSLNNVPNFIFTKGSSFTINFPARDNDDKVGDSIPASLCNKSEILPVIKTNIPTAKYDAGDFTNNIVTWGYAHKTFTIINENDTLNNPNIIVFDIQNLRVTGKEGPVSIWIEVAVPGKESAVFEIPIIKSNITEKEGKVGIGTNEPQYQLTLNGKDDVFGVENRATFLAKNEKNVYEQYLWPRWSDNIMYLNYGAAGFNIRNNSNTSSMFMTDDGNVGVGTKTPKAKLDVNGNIKIRDNYTLEFGSNISGKEMNAGKIGYDTLSDRLDIVGAGSDVSKRKVKVWAEGGTEFAGRIKDSTGYVMPRGGIIMWSGTIDEIPAGWVLCDGTNATPNLSGRFIVGVNTKNKDTDPKNEIYSVGEIGGEATHKLTVNEMPAHSHAYHKAEYNYGHKDGGEDVTRYGREDQLDNGKTTETGGNQPHENRPPYYALAFIMKL